MFTNRRLLTAIIASIILLSAICVVSADDRMPYWWESYPLYVGDAGGALTPQKASALNGRLAQGNYDFDMGFGPFGQHVSSLDAAILYRGFKKAGFRWISWMEGFGDVCTYAVSLKRNADGSFVGQNEGPELKRLAWMDDIYYPLGEPINANIPRLESQAWWWDVKGADSGDAVRYLGIHNCTTNEDFIKPLFTREKIGFPMPTYPDGRPALGWLKTGRYPMNAEIYDACGSKDINGELITAVDWAGSKRIIDGLYGKVLGKNDRLGPGQKIGDIAYGTLAQTSKDIAAPFWTEYGRFMVKRMLKDSVDGLWVDNFSPFNNFGMPPISNGFGDWSESRFRDFLAKRFSSSELHKWGIDDLASFNVRDYLKRKAVDFGARDPELFADPAWIDPRWLDEPVWNAYKVFKQQVGQEGLRNFYNAIKDEARKNGRPDFLISGNDIPALSHGWVRDDYLDMVSSEQTPNWHIAVGSRGIMLPPKGKFAAMYRTGLEFQKGPYETAWYYSDDKSKDKTELGKVLVAEAFANSTFLKYTPSGPYVGTDESASWWNRFCSRSESAFGPRRILADVGVLFSPDNQLAFVPPGSHALNHDYQPQMFGHWGFATAMIDAHIPYRTIVDWKLKPDVLKPLRILVLPQAECLEDTGIAVVKRWVSAGGRLIITGRAGMRYGPKGFFRERKVSPFTDLIGQDISKLPGIAQAQAGREVFSVGGDLRQVTSVDTHRQTDDATTTPAALYPIVTAKFGKGTVIWSPNPIDMDYFMLDNERPERLKAMVDLIGRSDILNVDSLPTTVGVFTWQSKKDGALFADLVNYNIDVDSDKLTYAENLEFRIRVPKGTTEIKAVTLTPDRTSPAEVQLDGGWAVVKLRKLEHFASVKITPEGQD